VLASPRLTISKSHTTCNTSSESGPVTYTIMEPKVASSAQTS
jgi:hypothetical protein